MIIMKGSSNCWVCDYIRTAIKDFSVDLKVLKGACLRLENLMQFAGNFGNIFKQLHAFLRDEFGWIGTRLQKWDFCGCFFCRVHEDIKKFISQSESGVDNQINNLKLLKIS